MARIYGWLKKEPRAWTKVEDSVEQWLPHRAWIIRVRLDAGTTDGTPNSHEVSLGPYAARLWLPVRQERFTGDRQALQVTHSLVIASDEKPLERDKVRVDTEDGRHVFRVEGTVNPRPSAWNLRRFWQLDVTRTEDY